VAGLLNSFELPDPPVHGVPVMMINNRLDGSVPYDPPVGEGVAETVERWVMWNECPLTPVSETTLDGVVFDTYGPCLDGAEVVLCTWEDSSWNGHFWPGEEQGLVPAELMWSFLTRLEEEP
jgi:poly(3-hydroxybutyrate) depolymerase